MTKDSKNDEIKEFSKDAREFIQSLDIYEGICKKLIDYYVTSTDTSDILNVVRILPENILRFISFISRIDNETLNDFFSKSDLTEDEVSIILSFRRKYRNILRPIMIQILGLNKGLKNIMTSVSVIRKFNQDLNIPVLELDILSFDKSILHTETSLSELYSFSYNLQKVIRDSLEILLKDKLRVDQNFIKTMKKINKDIQNIFTEISNLLEELSKTDNMDEKNIDEK